MTNRLRLKGVKRQGSRLPVGHGVNMLDMSNKTIRYYAGWAERVREQIRETRRTKPGVDNTPEVHARSESTS
jgi:hypothetical protein